MRANDRMFRKLYNIRKAALLALALVLALSCNIFFSACNKPSAEPPAVSAPAGGETSGEGAENPGEGGEPSGEGAENPGGTVPGGETSGEGTENPGEGGETSGEDGENPGEGGETSGEGGETPGEGEGETPVGVLGAGTVALFDFDADPAAGAFSARTADPSLQVTAKYSRNTAQAQTSVHGKAFEVTAAGNEYFDVTVPALSACAQGLTVSFWTCNEGGSECSHIARAPVSGDTASLRFLNLNFADSTEQGGNLYPQNAGVYDPAFAGDFDALVSDGGTWVHVAVTVSASGVVFYKNGAPVCRYNAATSQNIATVCNAFLNVAQNGGTLRFFGNNEGAGSLFADALRLGAFCADDRLLALYQDALGDFGTQENPPAGGGETSGEGSEGDTGGGSAGALYPADPKFDALVGYGSPNTYTTTANVHDPSVIEVTENGRSVYYVFSTDNMGPAFGYQIRRSEDLIHWEYVGCAIEGFNENGAPPSAANPVTPANELYEVYALLQNSGWNGMYTLWAPDVVEGADGKYWLYGCWTAAFGQGHSAIFLCKADAVTGPYTFEDVIVYSYDGWEQGPNAIDPQIYYADGRMFMAYGSFGGGLWALELDPATGLRPPSDPCYKADWAQLASQNSVPAAARYGTRLVSSENIEGPVVAYHENVPLYSGSVNEFSASAVTYENRYYLMGSAGSLSSTYNMRSFHSASPTAGYEAAGGAVGSRVSGSFTWKTSASDAAIGFDFAYPGHNDMFTTADGVNLLAYHCRTSFPSGNINHYLMLSMYGFNSRGELVMSPNRYAGERARKIEAEEIYGLAGGKYTFACVSDNAYGASFNGGYAMAGLSLREDGSVQFGGQTVGTWAVYGENWVYMNLTSPVAAGGGNGRVEGEYYGAAFPAWIEAEGRGGLTLSFLSKDGTDTLYLNSDF